MLNYLLTSVLTGITFGVLDAAINANSYAKKLFEVYRPISRTAINIPLGLAIDLIYGFIIVGLFLLLNKSLPGQTALVKGLSYGLIMWFFRVVMYALSQFMMFKIPMDTLLYMLVTGLFEMLALGLLVGLLLKV